MTWRHLLNRALARIPVPPALVSPLVDSLPVLRNLAARPDRLLRDVRAVTDTPFTDLLDAYARAAVHERFMLHAMAMTTAMLGVPYGPALCETRPSRLRGILLKTEAT